LQLRIHRQYQDPSKCGPRKGGDGGLPPGHQGSRADPRAKGLAPGPPGPLLWEETNSLGAPWTSGPGAESQIHSASALTQLLPNRSIDDILTGQVEPDDTMPPMPLDFPGSFDVLSLSP
ncbi:MEF2-activating motif and SAP domain-containing transcriptional regulator, partial [Pteropus vampyrus]|uniref:MEF2-activating motif and SAP domain-containing transcriptional regulator n=1 Tax=Pteropus vampyrus TaxID=132908 RepID=A0A6P6C5E2_PTEVA